jgi:hypothetical protein
MRGPHPPSTGRSVVAILCAACFLATSLGSVTRAIAADAWETWPTKKTEPGVPSKPDTDANLAAKTGEAVEEKTAKEKSSGTNWWIAAGIAVVIGIGIAIAAGGGGDDGSTTTNPGHQ